MASSKAPVELPESAQVAETKIVLEDKAEPEPELEARQKPPSARRTPRPPRQKKIAAAPLPVEPSPVIEAATVPTETAKKRASRTRKPKVPSE